MTNKTFYGNLLIIFIAMPLVVISDMYEWVFMNYFITFYLFIFIIFFITNLYFKYYGYDDNYYEADYKKIKIFYSAIALFLIFYFSAYSDKIINERKVKITSNNFKYQKKDEIINIQNLRKTCRFDNYIITENQIDFIGSKKTYISVKCNYMSTFENNDIQIIN